jgi:hypothetical protein
MLSATLGALDQNVMPAVCRQQRQQIGRGDPAFRIAEMPFAWPDFLAVARLAYRPWRNRSTAATSARRMPGSSAECPASGTIVSRAARHTAANSNAVRAGQIMS